jgi:voltage-gated potassium channel
LSVALWTSLTARQQKAVPGNRKTSEESLLTLFIKKCTPIKVNYRRRRTAHGQAGRTVIEQLNAAKIPYVSIETNEGLYRELLQEGVLLVRGDAKRRSVLEEARIARARGISVVIDNDADNLYITVTAKSLNPKLKIITRAGQEGYAQAMRTSGADELIIPEFEGGKLAGQLIQKCASTPR